MLKSQTNFSIQANSAGPDQTSPRVVWWRFKWTSIMIYQNYGCSHPTNHVLSVTSHINCIVARCLIKVVYLTACAFIRSCVLHFFEWRRLRSWISTKIENYVIITSLKSETMGKLINTIPGSGLLICSLPGSALRTHVESLGKPRDFNKRSQSLAW